MNILRLISGIAIMLLTMYLPVYRQTQIATAEELAALNDSKSSLAGDDVLMNDLTLDNWMCPSQVQSWWRYPERLTEKQRNQTFGFLFDEDEQFPWYGMIRRNVRYCTGK